MKLRNHAIPLLLAASGCLPPNPTPAEACHQGIAVACERVYACLTPAERSVASLPATEAACVDASELRANCEGLTRENACDENKTWHGEDAAACIDEVANLECSQIRALDVNVQTDTPACQRVCRVD